MSRCKCTTNTEQGVQDLTGIALTGKAVVLVSNEVLMSINNMTEEGLRRGCRETRGQVHCVCWSFV